MNLIPRELHLLYIWLQSNKITFFQKTYYVIFHRARIRLQNTGDYCNLNKANNLKYIGVIIYDTILWDHHITYIK